MHLKLHRVALGGAAGLALWLTTTTVLASFTTGTPPLINGGGRTQNPAQVFAVYWGEQWAVGWPDVDAPVCANGYQNQCLVGETPVPYTNAAATAMTYINTFLSSAVPSSTWASTLTQYSAGLAYGGSWVDTADVPPQPGVVTDSCLELCLIDNPPSSIVYLPETTINQLGTEALHAEAHFGYSPNADYVIYLPKGSIPAGFGAFCAYHNEIYDAAGNRISYSVMPWEPDANFGCGLNYLNSTANSFGNGFLDGVSIVTGHEIAEAATDALPFTAPAWRDSSGNEIGDICAWGTTANGVPMYNISGGGHVFAVQSLWSNKANSCV